MRLFERSPGRISLALKSDQGGIERILKAIRYICYRFKLKSDQGGIESVFIFVKSITSTSGLKSDQGGIERK